MFRTLDEYPPFKKTVAEVMLGGANSVDPFAIGLELEHEGHLASIKTKYWRTDGDGSLGGDGREYISKPFTINLLDNVVDQWYNGVTSQAGYTFSESTNTSTHVHINVGHLPSHKLISFLATYYFLEPLLFTLCREDRCGNNFCVDSTTNRRQVKDVCAHLALGTIPYTGNNARYAALNLAALTKFGTVEFRQMQGLSDPDEIKSWVTLLHNLVKNSTRFSIEELNSRFLSKSSSFFVRSLVGNSAFSYLIDQGLDGNEWWVKEILKPQSFIYPMFLTSYPKEGTQPVKQKEVSPPWIIVDDTSISGATNDRTLRGTDVLSEVLERAPARRILQGSYVEANDFSRETSYVMMNERFYPTN